MKNKDNLYEDELRKDNVISQLKAVIGNLEQIKGYTVQIAQLNTYYTAPNERNTRIPMYYHL